MKKILSCILAFLLVMNMSVCAYATETAGTVGQNGSKEIDVTAKYSSSTDTPSVYSVDIEWSSMIFTYTQKETKTWNAANHSYTTAKEGAWDKDTATITVTNHSNVSVNANVVYTEVTGMGISGTLANNSAELDAGVEGDYDAADSFTATLSIEGTPNNSVTSEGVTIGTIKVTIS